MPTKTIRVIADHAGTLPFEDDEGLFDKAREKAQKWADAIGHRTVQFKSKSSGYRRKKGVWAPYVDYVFTVPTAYESEHLRVVRDALTRLERPVTITGSMHFSESSRDMLRDQIDRHFGNSKYDSSTRLITVSGTAEQFRAFNAGIE